MFEIAFHGEERSGVAGRAGQHDRARIAPLSQLAAQPGAGVVADRGRGCRRAGQRDCTVSKIMELGKAELAICLKDKALPHF